MNEEKSRNLEGFAHMIYNQFERPLKDNQKFKEQYKDTKLKIFLNITDATNAALLKIENGNIAVYGIPQTDKEGLIKAAENVDALIKTDMNTFVSMENMSTLKTIGKMFGGKLKIKGGKNLRILQDLRKLAAEADGDVSEFF